MSSTSSLSASCSSLPSPALSSPPSKRPNRPSSRHILRKASIASLLVPHELPLPAFLLPSSPTAPPPSSPPPPPPPTPLVYYWVQGVVVREERGRMLVDDGTGVLTVWTHRLALWELEPVYAGGATGRGSYVLVRGRRVQGEAEGGAGRAVWGLLATAMKELSAEREVREAMWRVEVEEQRDTDEERLREWEDAQQRSRQPPLTR